jgi:hypothetical protein
MSLNPNIEESLGRQKRLQLSKAFETTPGPDKALPQNTIAPRGSLSGDRRLHGKGV